MKRVILLLTAAILAGSMSFAAEEGLVGHWDFDGAEGDVIADKSGQKNDGKLVGGAKLVTAGKGQAVEFFGKRGSVTIHHAESLVLAEQGSVALWFCARSYPKLPAYPALIQKGGNAGWIAGSYHFFWHTSKDRWYGVLCNVKKPQYLMYKETPAGQWHHIAMTWDGKELALYLNAL